MPVAFCKETYSSKLVLKDVVSGSRNVTESSPRNQEKRLVIFWQVVFVRYNIDIISKHCYNIVHD